MFMDANHWLSKCEQCLVAKGDYTKQKTLQGSFVAHQPLELLCMDFTKADVSKGGKENILVLTDAFSKYSQAFIISNQKSLMVAKLFIEKWFSTFGIPTRIHSNQGKSFNNEIISHLCKMYGISYSTTTLVICMVIPSVNISIELYLILCILWIESRSLIGLFICLHWTMLTILHHTVLQGSNHMSSCLGIGLQCLVIIGLGSGIMRQMVLNLRLPDSASS